MLKKQGALSLLVSLFLLIFLFSTLAMADTQVNVVGLFNNRALVIINGGAPKNMRAGQTSNGVKLISANSSAATFVIEGRRQVLKMGQAASVGGGSISAELGKPNSPVHLYANPQGHYYGNLNVNGTSLKYVIDSGATSVAFSSKDAKRAKINYKNGQKINMSTANGIVAAFLVTLNTLKIGTIVLNNVKATVIEGDSPPVVLLGMSAQTRLNMKQENSVLTLTKKY